MLASKPTSGLSFVAMIVRDASGRNSVEGDGSGSSGSIDSGSRSNRVDSNRLAGFSADPRPFRFGCMASPPRSRLSLVFKIPLSSGRGKRDVLRVAGLDGYDGG